jgi:hypothetical protein
MILFDFINRLESNSFAICSHCNKRDSNRSSSTISRHLRAVSYSLFVFLLIICLQTLPICDNTIIQCEDYICQCQPTDKHKEKTSKEIFDKITKNKITYITRPKIPKPISLGINTTYRYYNIASPETITIEKLGIYRYDLFDLSSVDCWILCSYLHNST